MNSLQKLARIIKTAHWEFLINNIAASGVVPRSVRKTIYRCSGIKVSPSAMVSPGLYFQSPKVEIGAGSFINRGVSFYCGNSMVRLGRNVGIAMGVTFATEGHEIGPADNRCGALTSRTIIVNDGCWVGANSLIILGVELGPGCVIAAGSVVTRNCLANGLYAGVPARRMRDLSGPSAA